MVATLAASSLSQAEVEEKLNLIEVPTEGFFSELESPLPPLDELTQHWLDKIQTDFLSIMKRPLKEEVVKVMVLSHLLSAANLTSLPFYPNTEESVDIELSDDPTSDEAGTIIRGRIDFLVMHRQLWVIVVESKRTQLNVRMGIAQALIHMMASPNDDRPTYGLVLNGPDFLFIKLVKGDRNQYAISQMMTMYSPHSGLHSAVQILRKLRSIVLGESSKSVSTKMSV
jgi:hypothetical protein